MKFGYIYCFSNISMAGILKIGMTERTPEIRLKEANSSDTWKPPTPYKIEMAKKVLNAPKKEKVLHNLLEKYTIRINSNREFFKVSIEEVSKFFELMDGELWKENHNNIPRNKHNSKKEYIEYDEDEDYEEYDDDNDEDYEEYYDDNDEDEEYDDNDEDEEYDNDEDEEYTEDNVTKKVNKVVIVDDEYDEEKKYNKDNVVKKVNKVVIVDDEYDEEKKYNKE